MSAPEPEVIDLTNIDSDDEEEDDYDDHYADVAPLDENAHTQLHMAIAALDPALLRQIVADLIDEEPYVARALYNRLATDEESGSDDEPEEVQPPTAANAQEQPLPESEREKSESQSFVGEEDAEPPPASSSEPVVVPARTETCVNCDEEFDPRTGRKEGECMYHPGRLEADEAKFVDWDEDVHGPMDTPQNRRDYPENFTWSCCKDEVESDGCRAGIHEGGGSGKKRARMS